MMKTPINVIVTRSGNEKTVLFTITIKHNLNKILNKNNVDLNAFFCVLNTLRFPSHCQ